MRARAKILDLSRLVLVAATFAAGWFAGPLVADAASTSGSIIGLADTDLTVEAATSRNLLLGGNATAAVKIDTNNCIVLNNSGAALAQNFTNGATYIPRCLTGAPSGVPTAFTGTGALVIGGDHHLYAELTAGGWTQVDTTAGASTLQQAYTAGPTIAGSAGNPVAISQVNTTIPLTVTCTAAATQAATFKCNSVTDGSSRQTIVLLDTTTAAAGVGPGIGSQFNSNTGGTTLGDGPSINFVKENATNGNTACAIQFTTHATGTSAGTTQMTLTSTGVLQLDASSPSITTSGTNANMTLNPNGTGQVIVKATPVTAGASKTPLTLVDPTTTAAAGVGPGILGQFCATSGSGTLTNGPSIVFAKENGTNTDQACMLQFVTHAAGTTNGTEQLRITSAGALNWGAQVTAGSSGQLQFGLESGSNTNAARNTVIITDLGTGTGNDGHFQVQTGAKLASGSTAHTAGERFLIAGAVVVPTNNVDKNICTLSTTSDTAFGITVHYTVRVTDSGGQEQVTRGMFQGAINNKAGTVTVNSQDIGTQAQKLVTGTDAVTTSLVVSSTNVQVTIKSNSSLTIVLHEITYTIFVDGGPTVATPQT